MMMITWESSQWLGNEYCAEYWLKELQENMDRSTGRRDITEILLKTALKAIQPINSNISHSADGNMGLFSKPVKN